MDEIRSRKEKKPRCGDNLTGKTKTKTTSFCRETGDHVHYPPTRQSRSTRAPSPILYRSSFQVTANARYGECRKNQAAGTGSTAYDGCGEFVTSATATATAGEDSVNCAACGCHRSFHWEESISNATEAVLKCSSYQFRQIFCSPYGQGKEPSRVDRSEAAAGRVKRLKTKFTAEQTEKMRNYADKLRWKVSHEKREEVDQFCGAIGVKRESFRVWMNNHKDKN